MRKTTVLPWTKEWENVYKQEASLLKEIFMDELLTIFHVGSTSVQAIGYAKPTIDILLVVKDINKVDQYNEKMIALGYEVRGENGILNRRYFPKGKNKRTHHVHIYQKGHEKINEHLAFKEYLTRYPGEAKRYGELKIRLATQFPDDHYLYQEGKQQFVTELSKRAADWFSKNNKKSSK